MYIFDKKFILVDTPDPYVCLCVESAAEPKKKTSVINNNVNPVWNETLTFYIDYQNDAEKEICTIQLKQLQLRLFF